MAGINKIKTIELKAAAKGAKLHDGGGLIFVATDGGGRWVYRFQLNGKRREMGLGSYPALSLAEARKERATWAAAVATGQDPIAERQRQRDEADTQRSAADPTFEEMFDLFMEGYRNRLKGPRNELLWSSAIRHHVLPKIGHRPISKIHQRELYEALKPIWHKKHETADKALYRSRMVFRHAKLSGYDVDPFVCDAARHMLGHVDAAPTPIPATPWQDIPALYENLCEQDHPSYLALRFTILTAARGGPVRGARFDDIDGDVWTVPADRMKGNKGKVSDFRIPLSSAALDVVETCRQLAWNGFLFPSPRANSGVSDVAMAKVLNHLKEAGRTHGFRTSFRTWVQDTEAASFEVAETALAHTIGNKVERSYARSDLLDKRRILMQKWADYVTQAESKVVKLRG